METINNLYESLLQIRNYLIKIGPKRRQGEIVLKKLEEAKKLHRTLRSKIQEISKNIESGLIKEQEIKLINERRSKLYNIV